MRALCLLSHHKWVAFWFFVRMQIELNRCPQSKKWWLDTHLHLTIIIIIAFCILSNLQPFCPRSQLSSSLGDIQFASSSLALLYGWFDWLSIPLPSRLAASLLDTDHWPSLSRLARPTPPPPKPDSMGSRCLISINWNKTHSLTVSLFWKQYTVKVTEWSNSGPQRLEPTSRREVRREFSRTNRSTSKWVSMEAKKER